MATYVLVHGAWSGAHNFRHVRRLLQQAGHEVFTPSLTGIGERAHLTGPTVDLTTHVWDVANAVLYEDLTDIVLVGFSYGGFVVSGALAHIADRVRHLVYLDAFVPADGQSVASLNGLGAGSPVGPGATWLVPPIPREFDDPDETAFAVPRRTDHPARCFTEAVRLDRPVEDFPFALTYIKATGEPRPASGGPFWDAADRARASDRWAYHEIATNHMIANNRPAELAAVLLALA
jgi:pimeloyl-ACP methyl ester carboxylesterase